MISVIIPVHNRAQYLKECLDSVFEQTGVDLEVIVVDDGSTDGTHEVVHGYGMKIQYWYQPNKGAASARNEGIRRARGEYIAFLDSDDMWMPYKLDVQLRLLEALPDVAFIHSNFLYDDEGRGTRTPAYMREYFHILKEYQLDIAGVYPHMSPVRALTRKVRTAWQGALVYWGDISEKLVYGPMYLTSTVLMRRQCVERIGLFNETYTNAEDFDYFARIAMQFKVAFVDLDTAIYRRHGAGQLSAFGNQVSTYQSWLAIATQLWRNDRSFYDAHKRLVDWKLSHYYYALGMAQFRQKQYAQVCDSFIQSLKLNRNQRTIYVYLMFACLMNMVMPVTEGANP